MVKKIIISVTPIDLLGTVIVQYSTKLVLPLLRSDVMQASVVVLIMRNHFYIKKISKDCLWRLRLS